jgi:hypothetical protein
MGSILSRFRTPREKREDPPQVSQELVRTIVREVLHELHEAQRHGKSPHDTPHSITR